MDVLFQVLISVVAFLAALFPQLGSSLEYVATPSAPIHARILFGGDIMFDRSIRTIAAEKGSDFIFSCLDPALTKPDFIVANLEGPITDHESVSVGSAVGGPDDFTFTFPTSTARLLFAHHIRMVNLGNNHILNFSREGLMQTITYLDAAGVLHFGDPDKQETDRVARLDIQGIPFSFVNWSDWTSDNTDHTVAQAKLEAQAGRVVVVYTHWGDEYQPATDKEKRLAHDFVDAGASIVIGSHPHIVQEHEVYNGKDIYYSLGNLIFDQYWNDAVRHGLMLDVVFSRSGVESVKEIPVELGRDRRTCPTGYTQASEF
ncbi:CapA family protein [Candidatus Kaiserbacteria bacterium]|nr:CapA family protein [Candidatus Kaiserbacteria bacterium]